MTTKIKIISGAANLLGKPSINDLNSSPMYTAMGDQYADLLGNIISKINWRFATKIISLNLINEDPPVQEWKYKFQLPTDLKALWRLYPQTFDFEIYQDRIYTNNNNSLFAEYTFIPLEAKFPDHFTQLLKYAVAADCAMMLTQNVNLATLWQKKYLEQEAIAMSIDARQRPNTAVQYDPLYMAHFAGSSR